MAEQLEAVYQQAKLMNKKEVFIRCNSLYRFLVDTYHFLLDALNKVDKFEADTHSLTVKVVTNRLTEYESYSDCNILKIVLFDFETSKSKKSLLDFLKKHNEFARLLERMLWSKDSEDLKFTFRFLQVACELVKDQDEKKVWNECMGLLATLDSYGKYLIEPQWDSVTSPLLQHLASQRLKNVVSSNLDLFWMYGVLARKAMQHENPIVIKCIMKNVLEKDIDLEVYSDLILDSMLPFLDNGKLYEDVGQDVDVNPKLAVYLRKFFLAAGKKY